MQGFVLYWAKCNGTKTKKDTATTKNIQEVVVLGYSKTATKAKSTAASTTVSAETLKIGLMLLS